MNWAQRIEVQSRLSGHTMFTLRDSAGDFVTVAFVASFTEPNQFRVWLDANSSGSFRCGAARLDGILSRLGHFVIVDAR